MKKMSLIVNGIKYEIKKELGSGGFGKVFKVLSLFDNKYYAIKQIPISRENPEQIANFQKEAYILSKFNSKNIVKYYDSSKDKNNIYILMELCDGENLRNFIDKHKNNNILIEENILKNVISQMCTGITEIHNKNIIHRDLKPENIFMNKNMDIKIGDFGIAKEFNSYKSKTITKNKAGTDFYIAPEILQKGIYNEKSDLWSLGCIIYELFTLNIYYTDRFMYEIKKVDSDIYNYKWQKLIDSLLQTDYKKRININQVNKYLTGELKISNNQIDNLGIKIEKMNINNNISNKSLNNNKVNIIKGEILIREFDRNLRVPIINTFDHIKRYYEWEDKDDDWKYENEKELKENIKIKINGKYIEFDYEYKFGKEGTFKIEYEFKNKLTKTCYMFAYCDAHINLDLTDFNTENVVDMKSMFYACKSLENLNLSNLNTKNVTDMSYMFICCNSLKNLDLSNFNTKNVTNMSSMFSNCHLLKKLNLSNFNTKNVTDMSYMFMFCESLTKLDLSNFNTQNVTDMNCMFCRCKSLTNLDLSNFNTKNVTCMESMFQYCYSLLYLNLSSFNTCNVINMFCMFYGCISLKNLDLSNFNTQKVINMGGIFADCKKEIIITKDDKFLKALELLG